MRLCGIIVLCFWTALAVAGRNPFHRELQEQRGYLQDEQEGTQRRQKIAQCTLEDCGEGRIPLHLVTHNPDGADLALAFLAQPSAPHQFAWRDQHGRTPLLYAVDVWVENRRRRDLGVLRVLLRYQREHPAEDLCYLKDERGFNLFTRILSRGAFALLDLLFEEFADLLQPLRLRFDNTPIPRRPEWWPGIEVRYQSLRQTHSLLQNSVL